MKTYDAPAGNVTIIQRTVDPHARIFTMYEKETLNWYGYSLDTGNLVWGPVANLRDFDYYSGSVITRNTGSFTVAYGNLYAAIAGLFVAIAIVGALLAILLLRKRPQSFKP